VVDAAPILVVVADANVLINLCHASLISLLDRLPGYAFIVTPEVDIEVTVPDQRRAVDEMFARAKVRRESLQSMAELRIFAELRQVLGLGEASCLALAQCRGFCLASDERRAFLREATARLGEGKILTTPGLMLLAIRAGLLDVDAADAAKGVLEKHRFTMRFRSFAEVLARRSSS
jgi:predicted nucleic acid-binding protein